LSDPQLTAEDVSEEQHISRRQLDRAFLDKLGMTVTTKIWDCRLRNAATMLRDPSQHWRTISRVALASGFEDTAHFIRAFKKRYGATPSTWRRASLS